VQFSIVIVVVLCFFVARFLDDEAARLRGPCIESSPKPALVGLPPTKSGEATPAGPPPGPDVPFEPPLQTTAAADEAELVRDALAYEPVLKVAKADRFWPVPVPVILGLSMGDDRHTLFVDGGAAPHDALLSDLRFDGYKTDYVDHPAAIGYVQDEFCSVGRAIGIAGVDLARWSSFPDLLHPGRSAQFYFLPRRRADGGEDLQYWFFYPYNYLPVVTLNPLVMRDPIAATLVAADFHEGDFEHVTVRLRPRLRDDKLRPVAVEMARHAHENRTLRWRSPELELDNGHPVVYAGLGGHASYEGCGRRLRHPARLVWLLDWALCDEDRVFALSADTPLVDLRSVPWACWPGHFGEVPRHPFKELRVAGPESPLYQAGNDGRALCSAKG
jgi:hypothetical protein